MDGAPTYGDPQPSQNDTQAAGGGPRPNGQPTFAEVALTLFENGYERRSR